MSSQASVESIQALRDFRAALAIFSEDALGALGAVDFEIKRTVLWLQQDRRLYWQDQIKRRRELVAQAKSEVFRRQLAKSADYNPSLSEQKEALRKAEESLRDAELRATLVKKWEQHLSQAVFEYQGSVRRIKDLASGDVPRASLFLQRLVDALEAYLREEPPPGAPARVSLTLMANTLLDQELEQEREKEKEAAGAAEDAPGPVPIADQADPTA